MGPLRRTVVAVAAAAVLGFTALAVRVEAEPPGPSRPPPLDRGNGVQQAEPPAAVLHLPLVHQRHHLVGAGPKLEMVAQLGGAASAVAARGDVLYAGIGERLAVLDIQDDARPTLLGRTAPLGWWPNDIALSPPYAYVAGADGLWLFDVADPALPRPLRRVVGGAYVAAVTLAGGRAYAASPDDGLLILDTSDPGAPYELIRYRGEGPGHENVLSSATDVAVVGSMAYVSNNDDFGLWAIDVSQPRRPRRTAMSSQQDGIALAAHGHTVFQLDNDSGLTIYDASDPRELRAVGSFGDSSLIDIVVDHPYAYLASTRSGPGATSRIEVLDVSDPALPREVATLPTPGQAWAVALDGPRLGVGDGRGGVRLFRRPLPSTLAERGVYRQLAGTKAVATQGRHVYVADHAGVSPSYQVDAAARLVVVDVADPAAPREIGAVSTPCGAAEIVPAGRHVFLACGADGVRTFDLGDPTAPRAVGHFTARADGLAAAGDRLYVASLEGDPSAPGRGFVRILDAGDPAALRQTGAFTTPVQALGPLATLGTVVFAAESSGIEVVDAVDPAAPRHLAHLGGYHVDVAVFGNRLYGLQQRYLLTYDVTDPAAPRRLATLELPAEFPIGERLVVSGRHVQVVTTSGIVALDMLFPSAPGVTSRWGGSRPWDAAFGDGFLFAATDTLGLVTLGTW